MKFKKIVSAAAALTLSVTAFAGLAVTANAADPIYSNDFSSENLDNAVTWTAASKKPTGYSYAQIGRGGEMSLADGSLNWTTSGGKNNSTVSHASYGIFNEDIQTATTSSNYKISFDWRPTCLHTAQNVALELINANKNVILGLDLEHTRANSSTGSNILKYYAGGACGFEVVDGSATGSTNAEGTLGEATKNTFSTVSGTTFDDTYNVELTLTSNGVGNLTITDSDSNKLVDNATLSVDAGAALSDIYMTAASWNQTAQGGMYLDNFVIEPVEVTKPTANYTVNYVCGSDTVKSVPGGGYVGDAPVVNMDAFVADNGTKYYCVSNDLDGKTIAGDNSTVVTVTCREANKYDVSVKAVSGDIELKTLYTASDVVEDTNIIVPYPRYIKTDDGKLYLKDAISSQYNYSFDVGDDTYNSKIEYALQEGTTAVYYAEGEDVFGYKAVSNDGIRCSMGKGGDVTEKTEVTTLQPGKYTLEAGVWGGGREEANQSTYTFTAGTAEVLAAKTTGSHEKALSEEFTIDSETAIEVEKTVTGTSGACVDYILICKTGDVTQPTPEIPDVTVAAGLDYTADTNSSPARLYTGSYTSNDETVTKVVWTITKAGDSSTTKTAEANLPKVSGTVEVKIGLIVTIDDLSKIGSVTAELQ